jgi:hypothetical protein
MMRRIIYTCPDRSVNICMPAPEAIRAFCHGGGFHAIQLGKLNRHIEEEIEAGRSVRVAETYIHGLAFGGHTEAEAYEIIRERDCAPYGTGFEIWDLVDIPPDRWFRDAWRRSPNGGPIMINMKIARRIQRKRIETAATEHKLELHWPLWRERIRSAKTPEQLKTVLPIRHQPSSQGSKKSSSSCLSASSSL